MGLDQPIFSGVLMTQDKIDSFLPPLTKTNTEDFPCKKIIKNVYLY